MIGYFFLALGCLFVAYCIGFGAGQGVGYKKAHDDIRMFNESIKKYSENEVDTNATVQTPEGSDREAP